MLVQNKTGDDEYVFGPSSLANKLKYRIIQRLNSLPLKSNNVGAGLYNPALCGNGLKKLIKKINPDIVHLHWIANGFIDLRSLKKIDKPIIWTLHDMWPFTGGCYYDGECGKFIDRCARCPMFQSGSLLDLSNINFSIKQKAYDKLNLTVVAPSSWLANCAKTSTLFKDKDVRVIHNGVNLDVFKPLNKLASRKILNLDPHKKYVLFGAIHGSMERRKGFIELCDALKLVPRNNDINLLIFGPSGKQNPMNYEFNVKYFGHLHDDISLSVLYSAADVMVVPSLQENLANTVVESIACGTPVVAFNIGGMTDMIEHKKNGYLADPFSTEDLANGIRWIITNKKYSNIAHNARRTAENKFNITSITGQYIELYKEKIST
jgi:glycosyltransferase involved in cell wall biosynthesis